MVEELNRLNVKWNSSKAKKQTASIHLLHMIEANIRQFEILVSWINKEKETAILDRVPYFVPTQFNELELIQKDIQRWHSTVGVLSTLFFSTFMTSRSAADNMYRLYMELTQPGNNWGRFTSIKDGFKKSEFRGQFEEIERFEEDFNRMRWIRNCYKSGAYCSSGGIETNGEIFLSLIMVEKDPKVIDTSNRVTESDIKAAIRLCRGVLEVAIKSKE